MLGTPVTPYASAAKAPGRLPQSPSEDRLVQVLADQAKKAVSDAVRRWNSVLRDAVRGITALRLSDDSTQSATTIPISVVDGLPRPLASATEDVEGWEWWLVLNGPALKQAREGLALILSTKEMLSVHLPETSTKINSVDLAQRFIDEILQHSAAEKILERFEKIEEDVLGAYWIRASKIQIYWMPLAVFAPLLGVSLPTLTVAVLCHELVHAYTHRGTDLNGHAWPTEDFIATDKYVTEGLAQYYTEQIMRGLGARLPDAIGTFLAKTRTQAAPYTAYQNWLGEKQQPTPEATRLAMLKYRRAKSLSASYDSFLAELKAAQAQMPRKNRADDPEA